jgi:hypothetical protein
MFIVQNRRCRKDIVDMEIKSTQVEQMLLSRLAQREVTELMHQSPAAIPAPT